MLLLIAAGSASAADCVAKTQPFITKVVPFSGYAGESVVIKGKWQIGATMEATCAWWSDDLKKFYALYKKATVDPKTGDITCTVPEREEGIEDKVKVTVQVWDSEFAQGKQNNYCFSHAGGTPDKKGEFGTFIYKNVECSPKTRPRVRKIAPASGSAGETIQVFGTWRSGEGFKARCFFWSDTLNRFYPLYEPGNFADNGAIECIVPDLPEGAEETVKVAVQVFHENGRSVDNDCFSHAGTIPDKFGEFGKFRYEGDHCCDTSAYHVWTKRNTCVWSCSKGTTPDKSTSCGDCVCKKGYVETGTDSFGRRVCERQRECSKKTQPRIKAVKLPRGEAGDTVKVFGSWMKGPGMIVRCFFWSDKLGKFYTMYDEGTMDNAGVIYCNVPEKEAGVEDDVKIAVQVYHITTQATQLNECFSHGGSIPDKRGEFGKFRYEGGHCCDISEYHVWTKRNTCVWSCSKGTTPDKATPCGECVCKKDHVETGSDAFGRRVCERVFDCEKRTQPKIKSVYVPGNTASTGEEIKLKGSWRRGGNMEVKCNFWSDELKKFYSMHQPGSMDSRGIITCTVPALPQGTESKVAKVTLQIYDINAQNRLSNYCFSHGGTTPDKAPEYAKILYA